MSLQVPLRCPRPRFGSYNCASSSLEWIRYFLAQRRKPNLRVAEDRLDSWKEIAVYLNRSVRTLYRWEKDEGLPVHRHQHKELGSVFVYKSELDAWVSARSPDPDFREQNDQTA